MSSTCIARTTHLLTSCLTVPNIVLCIVDQIRLISIDRFVFRFLFNLSSQHAPAFFTQTQNTFAFSPFDPVSPQLSASIQTASRRFLLVTTDQNLWANTQTHTFGRLAQIRLHCFHSFRCHCLPFRCLITNDQHQPHLFHLPFSFSYDSTQTRKNSGKFVVTHFSCIENCFCFQVW